MASKVASSASVASLTKQISDMDISSKATRQPGTSNHQKQSSQSKLPTKFAGGSHVSLTDKTNTAVVSAAVKLASAPIVKSGLSKQIAIASESKPDTRKLLQSVATMVV